MSKKQGGLTKHLRHGTDKGKASPEDTVTLPGATVTATPTQTNTSSTTPSGGGYGGGGSPNPKPQNPNCNNPSQSVDKHFISDREGGQHLQAYVPGSSNNPGADSNSGVTIATGIDLHGRTQQSMSELGWPSNLINELLPYTTQQGNAAQAYIDAHPLTITSQQADTMDASVFQQTIDNLTAAYNKATPFTTFDRLPANTQTAIADLAYQYGNGNNLSERTPNFWNQITSGRWADAVKNLNDFGDKSARRRKAEANLMQSDINNYAMPTSQNPCP